MFVAWRNNIIVLYLRNDATCNMGVVVVVYMCNARIKRSYQHKDHQNKHACSSSAEIVIINQVRHLAKAWMW